MTVERLLPELDVRETSDPKAKKRKQPKIPTLNGTGKRRVEISDQAVGEMRWLRENKGWSYKACMTQFGLGEGMVQSLLEYATRIHVGPVKPDPIPDNPVRRQKSYATFFNEVKYRK
jgi:hypothetical protein